MALPHALIAALLALPLAAPAPPIELAPVTPLRVLEPFRAPANGYAAGHRGVDLVAAPGQPVRAPLTGHVTFVGTVAGRPVLVISDGARTVSLEPVLAQVHSRQPALAGQLVGRVGVGGHCSLHCVHVGLRVAGAYIDPLRMHVRLAP